MLSTREPFIPETTKCPRGWNGDGFRYNLGCDPTSSFFFALILFLSKRFLLDANIPLLWKGKSLLNYDFQKVGGQSSVFQSHEPTPRLPAKEQALFNRNDISQQQQQQGL